MSVRPVLAVLLLLPLLPVAPGSLADSPFPQDDAGSGGDAGDTFEDALPLDDMTSFDAQLFTTPEGATTGPLFDREDWFQFYLRKSQKITVQYWGLGDLEDPTGLSAAPSVDLYTPDGERAVWAGAGLRSDGIVAETSGMWRLRAFTEGRGVPYHLEYTVKEPVGIAAGFAQKAVVVAGFELGPGGKVEGRFWNAVRGDSGDGPDVNTVVDFDRNLTWASAGRGWGNAFTLGAYARVAGQSVTTPWVRRHVDDGPGGAWSTEGTLFYKPGRWYIAAITLGGSAYVWFDLVLKGNASYLGTTVVPKEEALLFRQYELPEGDAIMVPMAALVSRGAGVTVPIERFMLGQFVCGEGETALGCRVERPTGVTHGPGVLLGHEHGPWRLTSDAQVQLFGQEHYVFAGADVTLPGEGGPPCKKFEHSEHPPRPCRDEDQSGG